MWKKHHNAILSIIKGIYSTIKMIGDINMSHIGNVIKVHRNKLGMSRKDLSDNICSQKYIYLIEKGERTPSVNMLTMISDRLGIDLFDYYQYLDCINPIKVYEVLKKFRICQRESDFDTLKNIVDEAKKLPDFYHKPWIYELEVNRLAYMVFKEEKYEEVINSINHILQKTDKKYLNNIYGSNLYSLLSTCYQIIGDLVNAEYAVLLAYDIVRNKYKIEKYSHYIVTVRLNLLTLYYLSGKLDKAIQEGNELVQYQNRINSYGRISITYSFLAFSYYKIGDYDDAFSYFEKALYLLLIKYKTTDAYYIVMQDVFNIMAKDDRINWETICKFKGKYDLN